MNEWRCPDHGTSGDEGWSCSYCGYPLGARVLELKGAVVYELIKIIDLFFIKFYIYGAI
jgi:hypothetical protein